MLDVGWLLSDDCRGSRLTKPSDVVGRLGGGKAVMLMDPGHLAEPLRGLRRYLWLVCDAIGVDVHLVALEIDGLRAAYLPLAVRLPTFPDWDVALLWDERSGWAVAIEIDSGCELVAISHLNGDVLPAPACVAQFVRSVVAGRRPGPPECVNLRDVDDPDLDRRLADYLKPPLATS